jgi:hypothetical protein
VSPLAELSPRNARIDSETGLRYYTWQGVEYPSMTSLLQLSGGVRFPVHQWAITQVVNRAVDNVGDLNRMLTQDDPKVLAAAKTWLRRASTDARDTAADLGTRVHYAATSGQGLGEVAEDVRPFIVQYKAWLNEEQPEILAAEKQVFNLTKGYAGSFDLMARLRDRRLAVVDIKTGAGTYPEHALQDCGYALGEFIGADDVIDVEATEYLLNANCMALLHIRPDGWEWQEIEVTQELIRAFNAMLVFSLWAHQNGRDGKKAIDRLLISRKKGVAS